MKRLMYKFFCPFEVIMDLVLYGLPVFVFSELPDIYVAFNHVYVGLKDRIFEPYLSELMIIDFFNSCFFLLIFSKDTKET
jgi:hypothetical protein